MLRRSTLDGGVQAMVSRRPLAARFLLLGLALGALTSCGDDDAGTADVSAASSGASPTATSSSTTGATMTTTSVKAGGAPATAVPQATTAGGGSTTVTSATPAAFASPDRRVTAARDDLVERFGYDPSSISVVSIEQVTWPNAALGCPATDRQYTQMTVEGYRIVLAWKDVQFRYHGAAGELPFLCQFLE